MSKPDDVNNDEFFFKNVLITMVGIHDKEDFNEYQKQARFTNILTNEDLKKKLGLTEGEPSDDN